MPYDFKPFDARRTEIVEWLSREFSTVRTGKASPALLDLVSVEAYGSRMPLQQVGSISTEDARTLRVSVWDKKQIKDVERAIAEANLGLSVMSDDAGVRVIFPELTSDRRVQLMKLAKAKYEESRVTLRKARDEVMKDVDREEKEGTISEDQKFKLRDEIQKRIDTSNGQFDEMLSRKEAEIKQ